MSKGKKARAPASKTTNGRQGLPSDPRQLADIMTKMADLAEMVGIDDFDELGDLDGPPGEPLEITVKRLPHGESLPLPAYQTEGASGVDLTAAVPADSP